MQININGNWKHTDDLISAFEAERNDAAGFWPLEELNGSLEDNGLTEEEAEELTVEEAVSLVGWDILGQADVTGSIVCESNGRTIVVCDVNGPWAIDVTGVLG